MSQFWDIQIHILRYKVAMSISKDADVRNISQMLD